MNHQKSAGGSCNLEGAEKWVIKNHLYKTEWNCPAQNHFVQNWVKLSGSKSLGAKLSETVRREITWKFWGRGKLGKAENGKLKRRRQIRRGRERRSEKREGGGESRYKCVDLRKKYYSMSIIILCFSICCCRGNYFNFTIKIIIICWVL